MLSTFLIKLLLVEYIVIMSVCVWEGNWAHVCYWGGAILLQYGVLAGMR